MKNHIINKPDILFRSRIIAIVFVLAFGSAAIVPAQSQQLFASPENAVKALKTATKAGDKEAMTAIFGPGIRNFVSGDPISDQNSIAMFAADIGESSKLERINDQTFELLIGDGKWPFAAPIIKSGDQWRFDTDAGVDEMLSRRIGSNEFDAMMLCQAYAMAQYEYFNNDDWDGDQVSEYAQKISSSAGKRDGLYWDKIVDDEEDSPLGELFAYASDEGYIAQKGTTRSAAPFHGYRFKVLFRQGPSAPGGKFNYLINGNMIAGFALVAYPATWGNSGVMTFMVNQEGRVYEKNLGPNTGTIAAGFTEYNPDATWTLSDVD
jgi:hypothetical protein